MKTHITDNIDQRRSVSGSAANKFAVATSSTAIKSSGFRAVRRVFCDSQKNVVGGLEGFIGLGWFHISTLWVAEELRGDGYGKALLLAAEQEAINRDCLNAYLFTYSFQAPKFYQHLGYEVFGELEDFPSGHGRYFLKKSLQKNS